MNEHDTRSLAEGRRRLDTLLERTLYAVASQDFFRQELLMALRKFAVVTGDLGLENACDEKLAALAAKA